jgi:hypothetical protein
MDCGYCDKVAKPDYIVNDTVDLQEACNQLMNCDLSSGSGKCGYGCKDIHKKLVDLGYKGLTINAGCAAGHKCTVTVGYNVH